MATVEWVSTDHDPARAVAGGDGYRIEHDTMGEVRVPAWALWGAQTQRAVDNFPVSGVRLERSLIGALGRIKGAAARANAELGVIEPDAAEAIAAAAAEVAAGDHDDHFPIDVFQTGSGTSSNMNANEVIAHLATERLGRPVHPNDEVNASQSSNDVFPSAIHVAAAEQVSLALLPALEYLMAALRAKAREFATVVKSGRTHLMDATPVTLGQEFGGYAAQVANAAEAVRSSLPAVGELPLGGTAVGTGLNCPPGFATSVINRLAHDLALPLTEAPDHFAAQGSRDALVTLSGGLRTLAVALVKIGNDVRWMASGPRTGLAEIRLPDLQPGSSIMPGKVNPVLVEAMTQVSAQVIGNDATVAFAGAQGNFEPGCCDPAVRGPVRRRHRGRRRALPGVRRVEPLARHVAHPVPRLRGGVRDREGEHQDRPQRPRDRDRAGAAQRRRGRPGTRCPGHDPGGRAQVVVVAGPARPAG